MIQDGDPYHSVQTVLHWRDLQYTWLSSALNGKANDGRIVSERQLNLVDKSQGVNPLGIMKISCS